MLNHACIRDNADYLYYRRKENDVVDFLFCFDYWC